MLKLDPAVSIAIRVARKAAGLSQAGLARACGVTVRHIFAIERGSNFNVALLLAIVRELPALQPPDVAAALLRSCADRTAGATPPAKRQRRSRLKVTH